MKIEIKSWLSDSVLFCGDYKNILDALKNAIKSGANLSRANLSGTNLDTKYCFLSISPIGSENGCLWVENTFSLYEGYCALVDYAEAQK
jgi:hypothetical protein